MKQSVWCDYWVNARDGVWDRITRTSCRWHQASSRDGGKIWDASGYMEWTRT